MTEPVCIVLNERESVKLEAASHLEKLLSESGIRSKRLPIGEEIIENIVSAQPSVLVLDYLLGDYSTGLDVLMRISALPATRRPAVFFFTDEPDVQVAVEAMRLGAQDYIPLESSRSEERLLKQIRQRLITTKSIASQDSHENRAPSLDELVFSSASSSTLYRQAQVLAAKKAPLVLIHGPAGAGKRSLAFALNTERQPRPEELTVDLHFYSGDPAKELWLDPAAAPPALSNQLSLTLLNAECDDGEFLDLIGERFPKLWHNELASRSSHLQVCTSDSKTIQSWKRLFPEADVLTVPSLSSRKGDFPSLAQRFASEAGKLSSLKTQAPPPETLNWLSSLPWPGEIRQLRAVLIDSLIASAKYETSLRDEIELRRAVWEEDNKAGNQEEIDPLTCAMTFEICGHRYRAAAARLGCSVIELYNTLKKDD